MTLDDDVQRELERIRKELRIRFNVREDAIFWFGSIAGDWTHEERVAKLSAALPSWPMVSGVHVDTKA